MTTRRKVLFDTSIYVDWLNRGLHENLVLSRGFVRYLSPVVLMELRAGVRRPATEKWVDALCRTHAGAGRIVPLRTELFDRAGKVLARLPGDTRRALARDVLVALSARAVGAVVLTRDKDFERIQAVEAFELEVVP